MYKENTKDGYEVMALVTVDYMDNGKPVYAMIAYRGEILGARYVVTGNYDASDGTWWHGTYVHTYERAKKVLKEKI